MRLLPGLPEVRYLPKKSVNELIRGCFSSDKFNGGTFATRYFTVKFDFDKVIPEKCYILNFFGIYRYKK